MNQDLFFDANYAKIYDGIDGRSDSFTFECPYGSISNSFIVRELPWLICGSHYYDIYTPYGYGGPVASDVKDIKLLMREYQKAFTDYCRAHRIVCEFIRFHLFDNSDVRENYYGEVKLSLDNLVVNTHTDYERGIWMNYSHKVRKNVKKALRNGLEVFSEANLNHLQDFLKVYYDTMDRNRANSFYYFDESFFSSIATLLPGHFMFFYALKDGVVVSTELVLYSDLYAYSFLGGTLASYYEYRPNDFLKDEIIKWCTKEHILKFVLGGGHHKDDGVYRYKSSFTKAPSVPFYIGSYIFAPEIYSMAVAQSEGAASYASMDDGFFPAYRRPK